MHCAPTPEHVAARERQKYAFMRHPESEMEGRGGRRTDPIMSVKVVREAC